MVKVLVCIRRQSRTSEHGYTRKRTKANSMFRLVYSLAVFKGFSASLLTKRKKGRKSTRVSLKWKARSNAKFSMKVVSRGSCLSYTDSTGI